MNHHYQTTDPTRRAFAVTNAQTVAQRVAILAELLPGVQSIGELCCGDCQRQWRAYTEQLGIRTFCGLDLDPAIVARNRQMGIDCRRGDVLDPDVLRPFLAFDVLFFGPPLSVDCDGHRGLRYDEVTPSYAAVTQRLFAELYFAGTLVCICPKTTTLGDITQLWQAVQAKRPDIGLALIHYSYATQTGAGEPTEARLKYVELWFSSKLPDAWVIRKSGV
jgi:hypothetical protein